MASTAVTMSVTRISACMMLLLLLLLLFLMWVLVSQENDE
jgi:HAMP domain-containing protein